MDIKDKSLKFTIVADDRTVYVNGDPRVLDQDAVIPPEIHAIQWYGTWGEIEFKPAYDANGTAAKPDNERFFDPERFKEWFDGHAKAVERDEKAAIEHAKARALADARRDERKALEAEAANGGKA